VLGIQLHPKDHKKDYEFANFRCQSTLKSFDKHSGANHFSVLRLPPRYAPPQVQFSRIFPLRGLYKRLLIGTVTRYQTHNPPTSRLIARLIALTDSVYLLGPARNMWMCFEPPRHQVAQTFLFGKTT
jgi:hypothetical protein